MEDKKYNFTQKIITEIISDNDKLTLSVINDYCEENNIIPNIISEEKLKEVLELGIAKKIKIDNLQSQLDIANKKIDEIKEYVLENTYENPQYMDGISQLYDEKLNHILSIIGE